jgi:hypothetical protein
MVRTILSDEQTAALVDVQLARRMLNTAVQAAMTMGITVKLEVTPPGSGPTAGKGAALQATAAMPL